MLFPDAPTIRGLKHVNELIRAHQEGYETYILLLHNLNTLHQATIHEQMQPELATAFRFAQQAGVQVIVYNCQVTEKQVVLKQSNPI